jgi:hypothetical protein
LTSPVKVGHDQIGLVALDVLERSTEPVALLGGIGVERHFVAGCVRRM